MNSTRRTVLGGIVSLGCVSALGVAPAAAQMQSSVRIPQGRMLFSRRLERSMRGGAQLVIARSWEVDFSHSGNGIAIHGLQVSAEVEAPAALSDLAQIEENRSTNDMWPILCSQSGRILATGRGVEDEDVTAAVEEAARIISERPIPADERRSQMQYIAQMQASVASLLEQLPNDLFFPSFGPTRTVREIALPTGDTGQFEVSYEARPSSQGAWLESAERNVITRIADSERRAREIWSMRPIAG